MTEIFQVALVGAGIGEKHVEGFLAHPDWFRVSVICDRDAARAAALGARIAAAGQAPPAIVTDYDAALLARADIDIVDICLPPFLHLETVTAALIAGKHVICEKPLVGSLADVDRLEASAKAAGRSLMPVFQYRFGRGLAQAKHMLASGGAGRVYLASLETHWRRGAAYYDVAWRGKRATELGGVMLGHAIHIHDMLTHLVGEVHAVSAARTVRVNPIETEDCAGALFEMADGSIAVSSATLGSADEISRLRVVCEHVTMVSNLSPYAPDREPWSFLTPTPEGERALEAARTAIEDQKLEGYAEQFRRYYPSLRSAAPLPVDLAEARRSIELVTAMYHAAASGTRVMLPIADDHPAYRGWT